MWRTRVLMLGASVMSVLSLCVGCAHTREVLTPDTRDTLAGAPSWALQNAQTEERSGKLYFVGVSEAQLTSEADAIDQAYKDALRRVNDYVGVRVAGTDEMHAAGNSRAAGSWPHRISPLLGPEYRRNADSRLQNLRNTVLERQQWIGRVNVVDTWTVAERFRSGGGTVSPGPNQMRYGQVWKAKVLVAVPVEELDGRAEQWAKYQAQRQEWQAKEWEAQHELKLRQSEFLFDRPRFHFMSNTYYRDFGRIQNPFREATYFTVDAP